MSYLEDRHKIGDLLATYKYQITSSNKSGLGSHAKTSEEVYRGFLNILHSESKYQHADRVNEKAVDLYDPVGKKAIQIKTTALSSSKIQECFRKFTETTWFIDKKYDFVILLPVSDCNVKEQEFFVGEYCYINDSSHYWDNERLLSLVDASNSKKVVEYLDDVISPSNQSGPKNTGDQISNYNGPVVQMVPTGGDIHINSALFDYSSDNRQQTVNYDNNFSLAQSNYNQGNYFKAVKKFKLLLEADVDIDIKNKSCLYYILSKISDVNIYKLKKVEVDEIYEKLTYLESTKYKEVVDVLWLLVYFENIAANVPTEDQVFKMNERSQRLSFILSHEYEQKIERIKVYSDSSISLLRQLRYGNQ